MSEPKVYPVQTRLAREAARPGGKTLAELLAAAERRLEGARDGTDHAIAKTVQELTDLLERGSTDVAAIYRAASRIVDLSGFYGGGPLLDAAYSLCEVCELLDRAQEFDLPAVEVHVRALQLLNGSDTQPVAEHIVTGLQQVHKALLVRMERCSSKVQSA